MGRFGLKVLAHDCDGRPKGEHQGDLLGDQVWSEARAMTDVAEPYCLYDRA
jgi:hypothetical protein